MTNMKWTSVPPSAAGYYWVWQSANEWPCEGKILCTLVEKIDEGWQARVPGQGYSESVEFNEDNWSDGDTWYGAYWMGPIDIPELPIAEIV